MSCPNSNAAEWPKQLERDGFVLIRDAFSERETRDVAAQLTAALAEAPEGAISSRNSSVYASRNLLRLFPQAEQIWDRGPLRSFLNETLGDRCGLVRGLFFDKPPDQSWALPWHKDKSIAIRDENLASPHFSKVRLKAGVPHVEASRAVLESMLTFRIHLDHVTDENGPLLVLPGSHHHDESDIGECDAIPIHARAGDVLAMRPLLSHCSHNSEPGTFRHRRIIHLEFAAEPNLPDRFHWHYFQPIAQPGIENQVSPD